MQWQSKEGHPTLRQSAETNQHYTWKLDEALHFSTKWKTHLITDKHLLQTYQKNKKNSQDNVREYKRFPHKFLLATVKQKNEHSQNSFNATTCA